MNPGAIENHGSVKRRLESREQKVNASQIVRLGLAVLAEQSDSTLVSKLDLMKETERKQGCR